MYTLERKEAFHIYMVPWFMTKVSLQSSGKRMVSYINSAGSTVYPYGEKNNLNPYIAPYTQKYQFPCVLWNYTKGWTINPSGEYVNDLVGRQRFLNYNSKIANNKEKMVNWTTLKLRTSAHHMTSLREWKDKVQSGKRFSFSICKSNKGLLFIIYNVFLPMLKIGKNRQPMRKHEKDLNRHFSRQDIQINK